MIHTPRRLELGAVDGVMALAIVAYGLWPESRLHYAIAELKSSSFTLCDMVFGIAFVYLWRYCFILLKVYDKFASVSRRLLATFQGVTFMILVAAAYYKVWHPHTLTLRSIGVTFVGLICYEISRALLGVYFLDRLAARNPSRAIIIGSGRRASKAWRAVRTRYRLSLNFIGFVDDRHPDEMPPDIERRYLGTLDDLDAIILRDVVDLILIAMPIKSCYPQMQRAVDIAESAGVHVLYLEDIYTTHKRQEVPDHDMFRELSPDQNKHLMFLATKRLLDVIGATSGLLLLAPLLLVISVAIKVTSKGPVLLRQERYGHRRRRFTILKFRTAVHNAQELQSQPEHANEADRTLFNIALDPQVLPFGNILRTTSFDELPQLWNVLVGDMSLVGPRPMSICDVSSLDKMRLDRRFSVRPGMTWLGGVAPGVQWDRALEPDG